MVRDLMIGLYLMILVVLGILLRWEFRRLGH